MIAGAVSPPPEKTTMPAIGPGHGLVTAGTPPLATGGTVGGMTTAHTDRCPRAPHLGGPLDPPLQTVQRTPRPSSHAIRTRRPSVTPSTSGPAPPRHLVTTSGWAALGTFIIVYVLAKLLSTYRHLYHHVGILSLVGIYVCTALSLTYLHVLCASSTCILRPPDQCH